MYNRDELTSNYHRRRSPHSFRPLSGADKVFFFNIYTETRFVSHNDIQIKGFTNNRTLSRNPAIVKVNSKYQGCAYIVTQKDFVDSLSAARIERSLTACKCFLVGISCRKPPKCSGHQIQLCAVGAKLSVFLSCERQNTIELKFWTAKVDALSHLICGHWLNQHQAGRGELLSCKFEVNIQYINNLCIQSNQMRRYPILLFLN